MVQRFFVETQDAQPFTSTNGPTPQIEYHSMQLCKDKRALLGGNREEEKLFINLAS